jgi:hypothetical protein
MASPIKKDVSVLTSTDSIPVPVDFNENSITPPHPSTSPALTGEAVTTATKGSCSAVTSGSAWVASDKGEGGTAGGGGGGGGVWQSTPEKPFSKINNKTKEVFSSLSLKQREQQLLYAETNPSPLKEVGRTRRASNESK